MHVTLNYVLTVTMFITLMSHAALGSFRSSAHESMALPAKLSSKGRAIAHQLAEELGLGHEGIGEGDSRHVRKHRITLI